MRIPTSISSTVILAALIFAISTSANAQANVFSSSSPSPTPSPSAEPSPTPIPISDVVLAAEDVNSRLAAGDAKITKDNSIADVASGLQGQAEDVRSLSSRTERVLAGIPSLEALEDLDDEWRQVAGPIPGWKARLQALSDEISDQLKDLQRMDDSWSALRAAVEGAETGDPTEAAAGELPSSVPASIKQKIREVLQAIEASRKKLTDKRRALLNLQARLSEREELISDRRTEIVSERDEALSNLLVQEYPAIWEPGAFTSSERDELGVSFGRMYSELYRYASEHSLAIGLHLALTLLLVGSLFFVRRRAVDLIEEEPKLKRAVSVFAVPVATGFLLSIALSGFFYPKAPVLLDAILTALILIPGYVVLERIIQRPLVPTLRVLVLLFLFDVFSDLFTTFSYVLRSILAIETVVVLGLLMWLYRTRRGIEADRPDHSKLARILHVIVPFAAIPFVVSLLANLLGYVSLARLLAEGILESAYLALLIYALYMVLDSVIVFAFRVRPLSGLMMVRNHGDLLHAKISNLFKWVAIVLWALLVLNNLYLLRPATTRVRDVLTAELAIGSLVFSLSDIVLFGLTVWLAFVISRITRFILEEDVYPRANVAAGVGYAVSTILHYLVLLAGFFIAISAVGMDLTRFAILAGAFGVGLGFGLQNIVNNFVSGIILLFERPFNVGDMIQVGDNTGSLKSIGLRASIIGTPEGADVIVPNGQLLSEEVTNWMAADQLKRLEINVGVKYGSDPSEVLDILTKVGNEHPEILKDPPPQIIFVGFGDNSLDFQLRVWADNESTWWITRSDLYINVYKALNEAGIEIPFPQRDLHIRSVEKRVPKSVSELLPSEEEEDTKDK
ncbi:MAG: mechanosensitive ion channel [Acidobacteriota bacterium]|nr:MAG: mechanosensitive ion channel [Acidobacteriota bacterium]